MVFLPSIDSRTTSMISFLTTALFISKFLADYTGKLSDVYLELQGKIKCISEMKSTVSVYKSKWLTLQTLFDHLLNMQDHLEKYPNFVFQT
jgi:hypothetical protein